MRAKRACIIILGILVLLGSSGALPAGQLDDFEKAATTGGDKTKDNNQDQRDDKDSFWGALLGGFFSVVFIESFKGMYRGGQISLSRVQGSADPEFKETVPRENGAPDLPFFRADLNYQRVRSDIDAFDGRAEAGYGPFGLQYRYTSFSEDKPDDTMAVSYVHGLYRLSGSSAFEFDAGIGAMTLKGEDKNSGFSVTFPITICPRPDLNIRLVPTWSVMNGNGIGDYDGSIAYVRRYCSLRFGYRRIQTHDEVLQGPYAGFSIHY